MNLSDTQPAISDARLRRLVLDLAASSQGWLHLVRYDPGRRWYQRVMREEDREVWLLSWLPGQRTGFHDHGSSAGAFTVVQGCLRERAAPGGRPQVTGATLLPGSVRSFGPRYVHDVGNQSAAPAVSVHAYSPPLATMDRFEVSGGRLVRAAAEMAGQW